MLAISSNKVITVLWFIRLSAPNFCFSL